jgi:hypothetical protein
MQSERKKSDESRKQYLNPSSKKSRKKSIALENPKENQPLNLQNPLSPESLNPKIKNQKTLNPRRRKQKTNNQASFESLNPIGLQLPKRSSLGDFRALHPNNSSNSHFVKQREKGLAELRRFRPIMNRDKRRRLLGMYPELSRLFLCSSKNKLSDILLTLPETFKHLMREYLKRCFILHLHLRQIKEFSGLMANRQTILEVIDSPLLLKANMSFANNLVKNFCKGVVNFVVLFYEELRREQLLPVPKQVRQQVRISQGSSDSSNS